MSGRHEAPSPRDRMHAHASFDKAEHAIRIVRRTAKEIEPSTSAAWVDCRMHPLLTCTPRSDAGRSVRVLLAVVGLLGGAAVSAGQTAVPAEPNTIVPGVAASANTYVNDSLEAREELDRAARLAGRGLWRQAARIVVDAVDAYGEKLIRRGPGHYESIPACANRMVGTWPAEGLAAYRDLREEEARQRFAPLLRRRDLEGLLALLERCFCTETAVDIGDALAQSAIERGDFALARRVYKELFERHPDHDRIAADVAGKLAVTYALWGRTEPARRWTEEAERENGHRVIRWKGQQCELSTVVEQCLAFARTRRAAGEGFVWPVFGGEPGRNRVIALETEEPALLWRVRLDEDSGAEGKKTPGEPGKIGRIEERRRSVWRQPSMFPVVSDGLIFASDGRTVRAVLVRSGALLWTYEGFGSVPDASPISDRDVAPWYSVVVDGRRLYASLSCNIPSVYGYESKRSESILVCLDAATGVEQWRVEGTRLGAAYSRMHFDAAPVVRDGQVFVVVRRQRTFGFEDAYACRFDGVTGALRFQTHIGGGSTGGFGFRRSTTAIPAMVDDELYVVSNLGTVACVSAHSGRVRWLRVYEGLATEVNARTDPASRHDDYAWQFTPVFCSGEKLICLPLDSDSLLVIDRRTGEVLSSVSRKTLANTDTVFGVFENRLYGLGTDVFCYDFARGEFVWRSPIPAETAVFGRGVLTSSSVLVPTRDALRAFDVETGAMTESGWPGDEAGNLLATPGVLLVAGPEHLAAYARESDVWARLQEAMRDDPGDPEPALELADVAMRLKRTDRALGAIDEAVRRAGGFVGPMDASVKQRIFDRCLGFAGKLEQVEPVDLEAATRLYRIASQCAPDAAAHVRYRFRFAAFSESTKQFEPAVDLYQQVLADRSLRELQVAEAAEVPHRAVPAGRIARQRIDRLIRVHGREVYACYDEHARKLLAAARDSSPRLLDRVADEFTNSLSAPVALMEKGRLLLRADQPLAAAKAFQRALGDFPQQVDGAEAMRCIADCYVAADRPEHAWRWLTRAMRDYPGHRFERDGAALTFAEYRRRLAGVQARLESMRPRIAPPLSRHESRTFNENARLLAPTFVESPRMRWGAYYVYTGRSVRAFEAATGSAQWDEPAPLRMRPDLLASTAERVLLTTRHQLVGLDARTGRRMWSYGNYPAKLLDAGTDPESFTKFRAHGFDGDRLVSVQENGDAVCLDADSGNVIWRRWLTPKTVADVIVSEPWVVCRSAEKGATVFGVLTAASGEEVCTVTSDLDEQVLAAFVSLEDRLIVVTAQRVSAFDLDTGRAAWQLTRTGPIASPSVQMDLDGLYLSHGSRVVEKLGLCEGRTVWESAIPGRRSYAGVICRLQEGRLVSASERNVCAWDAADGRLLWESSLPRRANFSRVFAADGYIVAIDAGPRRDPHTFTAHFYDIHEGRDGGLGNDARLELPGIEEIREAVLCDGALVVQSGNTIHRWTAGD